MENLTEKSVIDIEKVCRTCLLECEKMTSIFITNKIFETNSSIEMYELLEECASVMVSPNDGLPSKMCENCVLSLNQVFKFRKQCKESDSVLRDIIKYRESQSDESIIKQEIYDKCEVDENINNAEDTDENCFDELKSTSRIKKVNAKSKNKTQLRQGQFACTLCNKVFKRKDYLKYHMITHSGSKPFHCEICKKRFTTARSLDIHNRLHTGERTEICPLCNKSYVARKYLMVHIKSHHQHVRSYLCSICGRGFCTPSALSVHIKRHAGEKSYVCDICNRGFNALCDLNNHIKIHGTERPHLCPECGKGFLRAAHLKHHLVMHSGQKPFDCNLCNKSFAKAENLNAHMRSHTGEMPFKCSHCDKQFCRKHSLKSHINKCHLGLKF